MPKSSIKVMYNAALLHDIGKIGVLESILNKKSRLDSEEYRMIKKHPEFGEQIRRKKLEVFMGIHNQQINRCWILGIIFFLIVFCDAVTATTTGGPSPPRYGGKFSVPLSSEPESLDPAFITDIYAVTIANNLFDGLVEFDKDLIPSNKYNSITTDPQYQKNYTLVSKPTLNLVYVGMNCNIQPLNDVRVRQALSLAVDTEKIVRQITRRGSIPAKGILPPGAAGFDPEFNGHGYNPVRARKLLAEAGYPEGRGVPPLEIWTVSKSESVQQELRAYQKYMADIGIKIVPKVADNWKHFITLINKQKVPLYYAAWYADYPDPDNFLYVLCHSKSRTNPMGYQNAEIDHKLEKARQEVNYMERMNIYREVQRQVMKEAPLIAQHVNSFNYLFQPWVKGIEVNYLGAAYIPFRKVWIDYLEVANKKVEHEKGSYL